jgi:hypothetical protein
MELILLRMFQRQVLSQCEYVMLAAEDVNAGLNGPDLNRVFFSLQNLLTAAANASKALWGPQHNRDTAAARKPLRDSIGVRDDSPLKQVTMRNHYEHFDERLDTWWKKSKNHHSVDREIGPSGSFLGFDPLDMFRWFDPTAAKLEFWGQSFDIQAVINEVRRILPKLREEANKPHWLL